MASSTDDSNGHANPEISSELAAAQAQVRALQEQLRAVQADNANAALSQKETSQIVTLNHPDIDPQGTHVDNFRIPKIPSFFYNDPALWFDVVDAAFTASNITMSKTRAGYVVSCLSGEIVSSIRDLLPITNDPQSYDKIKERIISIYAASSQSRIRQLLKGQIPTDGKPSLLLQRLRSLNQNKTCPDNVLRTLFLEHLPPVARSLLATATETDLDILATKADLIVEAHSWGQPDVAPVSPLFIDASQSKIVVAPPLSSASNPFESLKTELHKISSRLNRLEIAARSSSPRSRSQNRRSRSKSTDRSNICYFHKKFGEKAFNCKGTADRPCEWSDSEKGN